MNTREVSVCTAIAKPKLDALRIAGVSDPPVPHRSVESPYVSGTTDVVNGVFGVFTVPSAAPFQRATCDSTLVVANCDTKSALVVTPRIVAPAGIAKPKLVKNRSASAVVTGSKWVRNCEPTNCQSPVPVPVPDCVTL